VIRAAKALQHPFKRGLLLQRPPRCCSNFTNFSQKYSESNFVIPTADNNNDSRHVLKLKISGFTISSSVACVILLSCNLTTYLTFLRFDRGAHLKNKLLS
jgi:hypothetical protein